MSKIGNKMTAISYTNQINNFPSTNSNIDVSSITIKNSGIHRAFQKSVDGNADASDLQAEERRIALLQEEQGLCKHRLESKSRQLPRSEPTAWLASAREVKRDAARELAETASCKDEDAGEASDRFLKREVDSSKLYLGPGYTITPGVTNLFFAPYEFFKGVKAMLTAEKVGDNEGILENGIRVVAAPLSFLNSTASLIWYIGKIGLYFKLISETFTHALVPFSYYISGLGFIMCAIEGVLESLGLHQTRQFYLENYPQEIESLKKIINDPDPASRQQKFSHEVENIIKSATLPLPVKEEIEALLHKQADFPQIEEKIYLARLEQLRNSYFKGNPNELTAKKNELIRRVHPWLADEIEQALPETIQKLQGPDPLKKAEAKKKAEEIFHHIQLQSQKKILVHSIGLAAVITTTVGLILGCVAVPFFIPFIVLLAGAVLALARYYLNAGLMDSKGWEFKVENCVPSIVKAIYRKIIESEKIEKPVPVAPFVPKVFKQVNGFDYTLTVPAGIKV